MYYVYILKSSSANEIYIGSTNNLDRRLTEHNNGAEISTRRYVPWSLYYYEANPTEKLARLREKRLKHNGNSIRELKKMLDLLADRKLGLPRSKSSFTSALFLLFLSRCLPSLISFSAGGPAS